MTLWLGKTNHDHVLIHLPSKNGRYQNTSNLSVVVLGVCGFDFLYRGSTFWVKGGRDGCDKTQTTTEEMGGNKSSLES